jgi:hypothetical protein
MVGYTFDLLPIDAFHKNFGKVVLWTKIAGDP